MRAWQDLSGHSDRQSTPRLIASSSVHTPLGVAQTRSFATPEVRADAPTVCKNATSCHLHLKVRFFTAAPHFVYLLKGGLGGHPSQIASAYELRHAASVTPRDCGSVCKRQFPRFPACRTTVHAASRAGTTPLRAHVFLFGAGFESGLKSACLRESSAGSASRL